MAEFFFRRGGDNGVFFHCRPGRTAGNHVSGSGLVAGIGIYSGIFHVLAGDRRVEFIYLDSAETLKSVQSDIAGIMAPPLSVMTCDNGVL